MNIATSKIAAMFRDKRILAKFLAILIGFFAFRLLSNIPIPGIDASQIQNFLNANQFLGLINIFSGGGLSTLSLGMLGIGPYITASIILQLMTVMIPSLKKMYHEEGSIGRKKFNNYTRWLTVPLALIQGLAFLLLLSKQGVIPNMTPMIMLSNMLIITAGSVLAMWIGELLTEYGIGNGTSMLVFAGIVASIPRIVSQASLTYTPQMLPMYIGLLLLLVIIVAGITYVTEAERPVPIVYAKSTRSGNMFGGVSSYIPLRINMTGVMPIIFAPAILLFPQFILRLIVGTSTTGTAYNVLRAFEMFSQTHIWYPLTYFLLVVIFTFFYTAVTVDVESMSENLQKNGAFIPGVRPGEDTAEHIGNILTRITVFGSIFLGLIAVLPVIIQNATNMQLFAIGGTSVLIAVNVITDVIKKVDAYLELGQL
ncbi:MAG TPA: preprotein translocase subunit SecY [Candidatus Paceibacterota bacterium]